MLEIEAQEFPKKSDKEPLKAGPQPGSQTW